MISSLVNFLILISQTVICVKGSVERRCQQVFVKGSVESRCQQEIVEMRCFINGIFRITFSASEDRRTWTCVISTCSDHLFLSHEEIRQLWACLLKLGVKTNEWTNKRNKICCSNVGALLNRENLVGKMLVRIKLYILLKHNVWFFSCQIIVFEKWKTRLLVSMLLQRFRVWLGPSTCLKCKVQVV